MTALTTMARVREAGFRQHADGSDGRQHDLSQSVSITDDDVPSVTVSFEQNFVFTVAEGSSESR